jgi:NADPH:quinone reductase-like Zn-dependent oxidoreductase
MQVAGIRRVGARVEMIEAGEPRPPAGDEVLLEVRTAGVGNWDEFVRTGSWDVGAKPPMALGVEAAGTVLAVGQAVGDWAPGDAVMTHPVPLRDQGTWAPQLIAPARQLARKPPNASCEVAAAFPVPALTAEQVLGDALNIHAGEQLRVHGAGGVAGGLLVALSSLRGAQVIATAGPASQQRVSALGVVKGVLQCQAEGTVDAKEALAVLDAANRYRALNRELRGEDPEEGSEIEAIRRRLGKKRSEAA